MTNADLLQRLKAVECGDATYHPESQPLVFAKGQGSRVWDSEGREYLDFCAGFSVLAFGHRPPYVSAALQDDLGLIHGMGDVYPSEDKILLLEALQGRFPQFAKAALAISGAGAIEVALKTAMLRTGQAGFVCFDQGYHGVDLGTLPVTHREDFKKPFAKYLGEGVAISLPLNASGEEVAAAVDQLAATDAGFAGIIVEPIQGRGGIVSSRPEFLHALKSQCERGGGLLIFDEIFCGLGRAGRMSFSDEFACDLLCLGKALGGGLPLSVCLGTQAAMGAWPESRGEAIHTGTFFGHPLACRLARLTLQELEAPGFLDSVRTKGEWQRQFFRKHLTPEIATIRGEGLMNGLVFTRPGQAVTVFDQLRTAGLITLPSGPHGDVLSLTPCLNISQNDLEKGCQMILSTLN